jgi:hypothetical protein
METFKGLVQMIRPTALLALFPGGAGLKAVAEDVERETMRMIDEARQATGATGQDADKGWRRSRSRRSGSSAPAERPPSEILEPLRYFVRFPPVHPLRLHCSIPSNPSLKQG